MVRGSRVCLRSFGPLDVREGEIFTARLFLSAVGRHGRLGGKNCQRLMARILFIRPQLLPTAVSSMLFVIKSWSAVCVTGQIAVVRRCGAVSRLLYRVAGGSQERARDAVRSTARRQVLGFPGQTRGVCPSACAARFAGATAVICINEIRMHLLGASCATPGLHTIVTNLVTSTKDKRIVCVGRAARISKPPKC